MGIENQKKSEGLTDELRTFIKDTVGEAVSPLVEKLRGTKATDNLGGGAPQVDPEKKDAGSEPTEDREVFSPRNVKARDEGGGIRFARFVKALAVGEMTGISPAVVARKWGYFGVAKAFDDNRMAIEKALSQGTFADGGALVPHEFSMELIGLLRNATIFRRAGARTLPMGASLEIPKQTGGGTAYWGQENTTITASQQTLGSVRLAEKKLVARTEFSNDLMRNASISAEEFIRDDLLNVIAIAEDLALIRGSGASGEPTGVRYLTNSANIYAETITTPGSPTLTEAKKELNKAIHKLKSNNVPMTRCAWFMSPRTEMAMGNIVGPGGEGFNSLEREMAERGTLRGYPFYVSQQIPENTGGGSDSELYLVDMDQCIIGESMALEVLVFPNGGDTGIQKDMSVVRCIKKLDHVMRYDKAAAIVQDISWGI